MLYIIIGAVGFTVVHIFDLVALKKVPRLKPVIWSVGSGILIYALVVICLSPEKLVVPAWLTGVGWGVLVLSASLLIHALFISLPFRKTYIDRGVGDKLVDRGVYALVRHPGVIWFTLLMLALIPVARSRLLLIAAPVFIALDIVLVIIQDKFIFGRMFRGYERYRRETPMLLPNKKSFTAFLRSFRQAKSQ
jgi:protein-S-isoprenylcysteine O-methyltransferase Ste14